MNIADRTDDPDVTGIKPTVLLFDSGLLCRRNDPAFNFDFPHHDVGNGFYGGFGARDPDTSCLARTLRTDCRAQRPRLYFGREGRACRTSRSDCGDTGMAG